MQLVLNLPMAAYECEQPLGGAPLGAQTGDPIDHFYPFLSRVLRDDVPPQFEYLCQTRPVAVAHQGLTRGDMALLDAPMPDVQRACGLLSVAHRRQRKDQFNIGA